MATPAEDADLVARRLVMPRAVWDRCVKMAEQRNGGPWDAANPTHVSAADVATEVLTNGIADALSRATVAARRRKAGK